MPRRVSASQMRSIIRQTQTKQRQAVQRYNSDVRRHNSEQKRKTDAYNRAIRSYNNRLPIIPVYSRHCSVWLASPLAQNSHPCANLPYCYQQLTNGWTMVVPTHSFRTLPSEKPPTACPFLTFYSGMRNILLVVLTGSQLPELPIHYQVFLKTWRCVGLAQSLLSILQTQMLPDIFAQAPGRLSPSIWRLQTRTYLLGSPIAKSRNGGHPLVVLEFTIA